MAWERVRRRIDAAVRSEGYDDLNPAHLRMFRYQSIDGMRPTQLADQMRITKQSVNGLLRDLEHHGYVERRSDPTDSRARLVHLTARGFQLEKAIRAHARAAEREVAGSLGKRRFQEFRTTLLEIVGGAKGSIEGEALTSPLKAPSLGGVALDRAFGQKVFAPPRPSGRRRG